MYLDLNLDPNNPECLIDCIYTSRNFMKIYPGFVGNTFTARYKL